MKTPEDEAFDEMERRQGGFQAKRAMATDKQQEPPAWWPAVENILNEYGLQAIDFVADFKNATAEAERNFCPRCGKRLGKNDWDIHTCTPPSEET